MRRLRCVGFAALLLAAGCLEVDSMEIQVVADAAHDRLDVMVTSRGVSSSGGSVEKDLAELMKCRDVAAVPVPGFGVMDFTAERGDDEKWRALLPFLDVEAGAFFTDEQGRLSFYQFLRINRPRQFAAAIDEIARSEQQKDAARASPATRELLARAAAGKWPVLVIDGAGFVVRRPLAAADHRAEQQRLWRDVVQGVRKADADPDRGEQGEKRDPLQRGLVPLLRDNDVAIVRRQDVTEYVVGTLGAEVCDYQLRGEPWTDNLLRAFVKNEPPPPKATQALIEKQFAEFHARAARLPAAFAAAKERAQKAK